MYWEDKEAHELQIEPLNEHYIELYVQEPDCSDMNAEVPVIHTNVALTPKQAREVAQELLAWAGDRDG